jgi:CCR4-NOT transcription complex subunit 7/8
MDTEFPGVVARPVGDVTAQDYQYKTLKCNVDLLKVRPAQTPLYKPFAVVLHVRSVIMVWDWSFHTEMVVALGAQIIQLGLSFADSRGILAEGCPTWQFNFKFSLK